MKAPITDYEDMMVCADLYAQCAASFAAVDFLAGDQIREISKSSVAKELKKYFKNVFLGFADAIVPDITSVQITKYVTDGIIALGDFASIKNGSSYTKWYNSSNNVSAKGGYTGSAPGMLWADSMK